MSSRSLQDAFQETGTENHRLNLNLKHELSKGHDVRLRANLNATTSAFDNRSQRDTRDEKRDEKQR